MIELKDIVFEFVKKNGPVLPVQVSKNINTNILLASAILSGLVSEKKVFLTHQNVGGSPLYYVKGQENKLDVLYKYLENAEKEAYDLLKNKKILKDIDLTAVYRVALRNIKDFAFKLEVSVDNKSEIFWKWYLIDNNEAEKIIKGILEEGVSPLSTPEKPSTPENLSTQRTLLGKAFTENEAVGSLLTSEINSTVQERVPIQPKEKKKKEKKTVQETKKEETDTNKELLKEDFFISIEKYLLNRKIKTLKCEIIKKGREIDFIVEVPSNLGNLFYYVKAINKKVVSNGDLSLAFNNGQKEKLPVMYLSNGKLSKKTEKFIEDNFKGYLIFRNL